MSDANDPRIRRGMEAMLKLRQSRLDKGEKPVGWKMAYGTQASMDKFGTSGPLVGFLASGTLLPSGSTVSIAGWTKAAAEMEIAVYMGKDLAPGADRQTAREAIAALGPAIELADIRFPPEDVEAILADGIHHRYVITGKPDPARAGCDLDGLVAHIFRDGAETATVADLQAMPGDYVDVARRVADMLAPFGETLRAGEFIIMGAVTPHLWLERAEDIEYRLEPGDTIALRIETA